MKRQAVPTFYYMIEAHFRFSETGQRFYGQRACEMIGRRIETKMGALLKAPSQIIRLSEF